MGLRKGPNTIRVVSSYLAEIELTDGLWTLADLEDVEKLLPYRWYTFYSSRRRIPYAATKLPGKNGRNQELLVMHRLLLGLPIKGPPGVMTDHWNRCTLDNTKGNLRRASRSQNRANAGPMVGRFRGVQPLRHRWRARIMSRVQRVTMSKVFDTALDAARWYNAQATELFGAFAWQNPVDDISQETPPPASP